MPPFPDLDAFVREGTEVLTSELPLEENMCPICHDTFVDLAELRKIGVPIPFQETSLPHLATRLINCGHIHGMSCLDEWTKRGNTCPICRDVLFGKDESDDDWDLEDSFFTSVVDEIHDFFFDDRLTPGSTAALPSQTEMRAEISQTLWEIVEDLNLDELRDAIVETYLYGQVAPVPVNLQNPSIPFDLQVPRNIAPSMYVLRLRFDNRHGEGEQFFDQVRHWFVEALVDWFFAHPNVSGVWEMDES
ncbi:hypothetical protein DM02DRAFT_680469 [Periconia macrospinosa]|uniref:RING-type domain-containing protein n=1 Tax=Periconia macrospinosa TaxID=97972 RepID=A0A2V1DLP0_9PLEO|nr:hypothetical protein DM02DRAFT_680469 [Periconia macrospinosa]